MFTENWKKGNAFKIVNYDLKYRKVGRLKDKYLNAVKYTSKCDASTNYIYKTKKKSQGYVDVSNILSTFLKFK